MSINELKMRDEEYWKGQTKRDGDFSRMLEGRDKGIQESFVSRENVGQIIWVPTITY